MAIEHTLSKIDYQRKRKTLLMKTGKDIGPYEAYVKRQENKNKK